MIPLTDNIRLAIAAGALLAAAGAGWTIEHWRLGAEIDEMTAADAKRESQRALVALNATDRAREEEARRETAKQEAMQHALLQGTHAELAHAALVAQRDGLLNAFRAAAGGGERCQSAGAVAASAPAEGGVDVRAEVFRAAVDRANSLAREADQREISGSTCEREYDSLKPTPPGAASLSAATGSPRP